MSRAAVSKSRADKKAASAQPQVVSHEIIPGKYNDNDWSSMIEHDDGDAFITDIIDGLLSTSMDIIYEKYIESQLLPFTIRQARDAILQIIEWQFLARDEGEPTAVTDSCWMEDEEPIPAIPDCWAQGAVPKKVIYTPRTPIIPEEPETLLVQDLEEKTEEITEDIEEQKPIENNEPEIIEHDITETKKDYKEVPKPTKKRIQFKPHRGRVRYDAIDRMHESLEDTEKRLIEEERLLSTKGADEGVEEEDEFNKVLASCNSIVKAQHGRPPGEKDVIYDEYGNVVSIKRIDPSKLPTHRVKVSYTIVDPQVEAANTRLNDMKTGKYKYTPKTKTLVKNTENKNKTKTVIGRLNGTVGSTRSLASNKDSTITPLPPPLIESMDVSPGVTVREGSRVKKGPKLKPKHVDTICYDNLRPVGLYRQMPAITVAELLERQSPALKPMASSPPIPPITPQAT